MLGAFETLKERGFVEQTTNEESVRKLLNEEKITFYCGFDPTADSLTAGHFVPIMAMAHLQRAGHRPIILVGGGTGMVGDPTDKTQMRRIMTREEISDNCNCFKRQLSKFLDFSGGRALMVDNSDWLLELKYVEFIREYGVHFSVNKMLSAESYKARLESGLTFFEFNYMLMQAYDYLELFRRYNCKLQTGGNDQWSNILAGADLIRRVHGAEAECLTYPLITTSDGKKMGKSQKGAIWLDANKTSPYEFYQYWRNTTDLDVVKYLKILTFVPVEEISELSKLQGSDLNKAKEILAFELTKTIHGEEEALKAQSAAKALFGSGELEGSVPETMIREDEMNQGMNIVLLMERAGLLKSRSEGRTLISQGAVKVNGEKETDINRVISLSDFSDGTLMIQKGKKIYHAIRMQR
ncbi:MAG: tyrosine--tRNA ligase [Clostridiales bacterium]|nr:tyrosine--tRNA ligase [Clostridiales bacterium]